MELPSQYTSVSTLMSCESVYGCVVFSEINILHLLPYIYFANYYTQFKHIFSDGLDSLPGCI